MRCNNHIIPKESLTFGSVGAAGPHLVVQVPHLLVLVPHLLVPVPHLLVLVPHLLVQVPHYHHTTEITLYEKSTAKALYCYQLNVRDS